ncbi:MAG: hypothetical protein WBB82_09480, partial [Limnothrix sp.]
TYLVMKTMNTLFDQLKNEIKRQIQFSVNIFEPLSRLQKESNTDLSTTINHVETAQESLKKALFDLETAEKRSIERARNKFKNRTNR